MNVKTIWGRREDVQLVKTVILGYGESEERYTGGATVSVILITCDNTSLRLTFAPYECDEDGFPTTPLRRPVKEGDRFFLYSAKVLE